ncbi:SAM-dependent methyltransferase [Acidihalobacter ferrooxydans]|uniref:Methyltransferase domain-containing protein n=1 Tax=Acidihalobacter ferrooxydans TaxID=1765967 RepID=A0A1P8UKP7_9GAMM|nr:class I SAM-dependent methyltransferase [Acidihalobacter ferrooxydans]APZ44410.1 hypothetical protein BW247_16015 [Acidihalobacter ferrooxydans]
MTQQHDTRVPASPERDHWNERYAAKEFIWSVQANAFLVAETTDLPAGRALDLAAGEGRNAIWLAERGWQVRAVDFSEIAAEKGQRLAESRGVGERVEFEVADLRVYTPPAASFDLVILMYLHLPHDALFPVLARAADAVAPGGTFLLLGHDASNLEHGHGGPQNPAVLYTPEQIVGTLGDRLEIEQAGVFDRPVDTPAGTRIAKDCLVRARRAD